MRIEVDHSQFYDWDLAPEGAHAEPDHIDAKRIVGADGRVLQKVQIAMPSHTVVSIPDGQIDSLVGHPDWSDRRHEVVEQYLRTRTMRRHAHRDHWTAVRCSDPAVETHLQRTWDLPGHTVHGGMGDVPVLDRPIRKWTSAFHTEHTRPGVGLVDASGAFNLSTDTAAGYTNRRDWQSKCLGGDAIIGAAGQGAATSTTATSLTNTGASFPTTGQGLAGHIIACGPNASGAGATVFGFIVANTATVITVDQWYNAASTALAAGTTPNAAATYQILPGGSPAFYLALSASATAPATGDTALGGEITNADLARALGTYSHTAAASSYQLQHVWTCAAASSGSTLNKEAVFGAVSVAAGGPMPFESTVPSPPTLVNGDQITVTVTINL